VTDTDDTNQSFNNSKLIVLRKHTILNPSRHQTEEKAIPLHAPPSDDSS